MKAEQNNEPLSAKRGAKPERRTQEERRLTTRNKLIEAVIDAIQVKGYVNLRTKDIIERAEVTWGAAQHIFGDKEELLLQSAMRLSEELVARLNTRVDVRKPIAERVVQVIHQAWGLYSSPYNFAMAEIARGKRFKPEFHERLVEAQFRVHSEIERQWLKIFADTGLPKEKILLLCNIVTLFLTGLAARKSYIRLRGDVDPMLDYMAELVTGALAGGPMPNPFAAAPGSEPALQR